MALIVKLPWTSQPQVATGVNWGSPLTRGLLWASSPGNEQTTSRVQTGTVSVKPAQPGLTYSIDALNSHFNFGAAGQSGTGSITVLVFARSTVTGRGDFIARWYDGTAAGGGSQFTLLSGLTVSKPQFYVANDAGGLGNSGASSIAITTTKFHVVVGSYSTGSCKVYVDGALGASGAGGSIALNAACTQSLIVGNNSFLDGDLTGSVAMFAVWNRQLSDAEVALVSSSPWQLFAPLPRRIWAPGAAAAGLPTLTASTFKPGTLTSSGWTARITAS